jgi:hypothetical protein
VLGDRSDVGPARRMAERLCRRRGCRKREDDDRRVRVVGVSGGSPKMKNLMKAKMRIARESWPRKKAVSASIAAFCGEINVAKVNATFAVLP